MCCFESRCGCNRWNNGCGCGCNRWNNGCGCGCNRWNNRCGCGNDNRREAFRDGFREGFWEGFRDGWSGFTTLRGNSRAFSEDSCCDCDN